MWCKVKVWNSDVRSFLYYLNEANDKGQIKISRDNSLGLLMCSMVKYSCSPDTRGGEDIVEFILPKSRSTISAQRKFCYFTQEDEAKINDYIKAMLLLDFDRHWVIGCKHNLKRKDIINCFVISRGLTSINIDQSLTKKAYRNNLQQLEAILNSWYHKANYIDRRIRHNIYNYIKN